ncbi:murein biosynthesis integral membrane protein MurJ [Syntrophotalea acetylenivorans]|uniref:Probable lipid II flippase MurJ n=1 Tax=Syntrophotalea acetylenivorans TaxID=1842532 RepID=A0A1L3GLK1_9BACT|nr:murein biosynthesis integral membrane protein MurJ [Syntrophotalea acetylenivorans]APG26809.1 murein biosynthesis integral membrane protein MurJ [Syntrophotalea acetylenivorans]
MSEKKQISTATAVMGAATGLSRIAGLVRDMVVASLFGAGFGTDAFFMAFTIPNLLRRFFAEGALTAAFVPTFSTVYHKQGADEARKVADICWTLLLLVMLGVTLLGIWASPVIVRAIGAGYGAVAGKLVLTDFLNRLMFPYIFFVSLLALVTGILNVLGHYFFPSFSTVLLNVSMIVCAVLLAPLFPVQPIVALAIGVLIGGFLQLALQFPVLRRKGIRLRFNFNFSHPSVKRIAQLMLPGLAGVAIYQINVVVSRLLASYLPEGSVSYLYYGQRLFELPQGIFVVSLAQAVLPAMSRQAAGGDHDGLKESLRFSLVLISIVTLPAAAGLIVCAVPVYSLFFMRGAFSYQDVSQTALALGAYAPGLLFVGVSRILVPTFYALQDTRTPVWVSFWTFLVNAILGLILMGPLRHVGLALALSLSSVCNCLLLVWLLRGKIGSLGLFAVSSSLLRAFPATLFMAGCTWLILQTVDWQMPGLSLGKMLVLGCAVAVGIAIYCGACLVCGVTEIRDGLQLVWRKLGLAGKA